MSGKSHWPASWQDLRQIIIEALQQHFVLRWVLANTVGWSLAFIVGGMAAGWFSMLGPIVPGLAGMLIGGMVGLCQWYALSDVLKTLVSRRRWLLWSALGGLLGMVPAGLLSFVLILGTGTGYAVMGAAFGLGLGGVQSLTLRRDLPELPLIWLIANGFGGCLCGLFALGIPPFGLPVFCTFGPPLFGIVTAAAWHVILSAEIEES